MRSALTNTPVLHLESAPPVRVTENQRKVIEDKYLKDAPTIEAWLAGVARNIALTELLYHPSAYLWGLFDGVRVLKKEMALPALSDGAAFGRPFNPSWLFHQGLASATERDTNFHRFLNNAADAIEKHREAKQVVSEWENRFYDLLSTWRFLPNSPTLMNAGRDLQQLSACYVLPVEDSMEGITSALQAQALIHKSGGGTGFSFGRMRPSGDAVKSTEGVASGVISFLHVFDRMTAVVKQGGNRRGANMGILPYWHPEINEFIRLKSRAGVLENFNISVAVDERFWEAVANDWEYDLVNPRNLKVTGRASAKDVFNLIVENAWGSGDPGIIFIDRINNSASNTTPALGAIEATNPCGEQPLLPNEPCNLGSLNLSGFVEEEETRAGEPPRGQIQWDALKNAVHLAVRFLDNVIDVNNYPLAEMETLAKGNRRIGLGVMGWAEALVKTGTSYDSPEAIALAREVMAFINTEALAASEALALERGVFPNWKNSVYDPAGAHFRGTARYPRHCARTTIAPTGTIGLAAGLQGAGIEPFYALAYTRYTAQGLEAVKNGAAPAPSDVYHEVNPLFRRIAKENDFFGLKEKELWQRIEKNNKSARGVAGVPQWVQNLFPTAHDISPEMHLRVQAAFQEHTDNAVSKTINLPHSATATDVRHAFELAHTLGCKGLTVYRDGSKKQQVLNLSSQQKKTKRTHDLSLGVSSEYYEIKTGHGPLHVHIDYDEDGPYRVFASLPPPGTEIAGLTTMVGVLVSKYLEEGGDATRLVKHLQSIKGDRPMGLGENRVNSIPHAIAIALRAHLKKHGTGDPETSEQDELVPSQPSAAAGAGDPAALELWNLAASGDQCPECYSSNIRHGAGCSGPVCNDCGYSECN